MKRQEIISQLEDLARDRSNPNCRLGALRTLLELCPPESTETNKKVKAWLDHVEQVQDAALIPYEGEIDNLIQIALPIYNGKKSAFEIAKIVGFIEKETSEWPEGERQEGVFEKRLLKLEFPVSLENGTKVFSYSKRLRKLKLRTKK